MADTDPPTTQVTHQETSDDQPSQVTVLDPPTLSFIPTPSNLRPSTGRTSITQVEHSDDDEQILDPEPTSQDVSRSPSNASTHRASELISNSQDRPQSAQQQPSTPTQQPLTVSQTVPQMPLIYLTFLLISGKRRTMSFEPESPVGRVKELVWNSWPTEWRDERPPAPSYLRVLYLGRMLQDDETLISLRLPTYTPQSTPDSSSSGPTPTIVHLSIRLYQPLNDDPKKKNKRIIGTNNGDDDGSEATCCHCVIS